MKFDLEYLEKLANIVYENDLSEVMLEDEEKAICMRREKQVVQAAAPMVMPATVTSQVVAAPAAKPAVAEAVAPAAPKGTPITAPMVGTFYAAP